MSNELDSWEAAVESLRADPNAREAVLQNYYDDPVVAAAERFRQSEEWVATAKILSLRQGARVLDLGAGRGIASYALARAGCRVTALEPDNSKIVGSDAIRTLAAQTSIEVQIIHAYGEQLPLADNRFDLVYGRAVLHHAQDLPALCREVQRVLKPGGRCLFVREHVISHEEDRAIFLRGHLLHRYYGGENAFLLPTYKTAFIDAGLRMQKTFAPFESVINYAPLTRDEFRLRVGAAASHHVGATLGKCLSRLQVVRNWYGRHWSRKSNLPGRLYSFLAHKK